MSQAGAFNENAAGAPTVDFLVGNSGGAVGPNGASQINVIGTGSLTIVGNPGTHTLTAQLQGLTNHSLLVGAGTPTITSLGVATNGQLPIGSTGANPVLATLTAGKNIQIANGPGQIVIQTSFQQFAFHYVEINTASYTVTNLDNYISVHTSTFAPTITFSNIAATHSIYIIKDKTGNAATNNITLTVSGGAFIDGSNTYVMNTNYQSVQLLFDGLGYQVF